MNEVLPEGAALKPPQRVWRFRTSWFEVARGKTERGVGDGGHPRERARPSTVLRRTSAAGAEGAEGAEERDAVRDACSWSLPGSVATIAAHAFHRREYDGRWVVECRFFLLREYERMFERVSLGRTVEEKQAAAFKTMAYLAGTAGSGTGRLAA